MTVHYTNKLTIESIAIKWKSKTVKSNRIINYRKRNNGYYKGKSVLLIAIAGVV